MSTVQLIKAERGQARCLCTGHRKQKIRAARVVALGAGPFGRVGHVAYTEALGLDEEEPGRLDRRE